MHLPELTKEESTEQIIQENEISHHSGTRGLEELYLNECQNISDKGIKS